MFCSTFLVWSVVCWNFRVFRDEHQTWFTFRMRPFFAMWLLTVRWPKCLVSWHTEHGQAVFSLSARGIFNSPRSCPSLKCQHIIACLRTVHIHGANKRYEHTCHQKQKIEKWVSVVYYTQRCCVLYTTVLHLRRFWSDSPQKKSEKRAENMLFQPVCSRQQCNVKYIPNTYL